GMSQELDSNMAARAMVWSFDGSVQDANENVVLKSDHTLEALEFGVRLFKAGMNPSVMSWNAASNNQALNARQTGYILNSISAYRTAQDNKLPVADDIFFVPALKGPRGTGWASEHVMGITSSLAQPVMPITCSLARDGHLRDLEVRPEPGRREAVSGRLDRPLPRRGPREQAVQLPVLHRLGGGPECAGGAEAGGGHQVARAGHSER